MRREYLYLDPSDQKELVGTNWLEGNETQIAVGFDEWTRNWSYDCEYGVIVIYSYIDRDGKTTLHVFLPTKDDSGFRADFLPDKETNLSFLIEKIDSWAKRSDYLYINMHSLSDYCRVIGAYNIDLW